MRKSSCIATAAASLWLCGPAAAQPSSPVAGGALDGAWVGSVSRLHGPGLSAKDYPAQTWRIEIQGPSVRMFILRGGKSEPVKAGKFALQRVGTNATITAVDSGHDEDGVWIEAESWVLLQRSPTLVSVVFTGAVNNVNAPPNRDTGQFLDVETGEFTRVQPPAP